MLEQAAFAASPRSAARMRHRRIQTNGIGMHSIATRAGTGSNTRRLAQRVCSKPSPLGIGLSAPVLNDAPAHDRAEPYTT
jgi:hypothetical protein